MDENNDLLYEIKIGVGERVGIEEEGLYLVKERYLRFLKRIKFLKQKKQKPDVSK